MLPKGLMFDVEIKDTIDATLFDVIFSDGNSIRSYVCNIYNRRLKVISANVRLNNDKFSWFESTYQINDDPLICYHTSNAGYVREFEGEYYHVGETEKASLELLQHSFHNVDVEIINMFSKRLYKTRVSIYVSEYTPKD